MKIIIEVEVPDDITYIGTGVRDVTMEDLQNGMRQSLGAIVLKESDGMLFLEPEAINIRSE